MNKTPEIKSEPLPNSLRDWINQSDEKRAEVRALIEWGESLKSVIRDARLQLTDTPPEPERTFDGEDAEEWQRRSEEQGAE